MTILNYLRNMLFEKKQEDVVPEVKPSTPWPRTNTTPRPINNTPHPIVNVPRRITNTPRPIINTPRHIPSGPSMVRPRYATVGSVQPVVIDDDDSLLNTVVAAEVISDLLTPTQSAPVFQGFQGGDSGGAGASSDWQAPVQADPTPACDPAPTYEAPSYDPPSCDTTSYDSPSCDVSSDN